MSGAGGALHDRLSHSLSYQIARNLACFIPPVRAHRDRRRLKSGYDADKDSAPYVREVFEKHAQLVRQVRPINGHVLEIGPGGNVGVALMFLRAGAERAVCIDVFPWVAETRELDRELVGEPEALYPRLEYRCPDAIETTSLPSGAFDVIYSHACLEHVEDPARSVETIARLLRPGGVTTHQIDLRDHRDFSRPLEFLRHSDRTWRLASSRLTYTNRWRRSDWNAAFENAGLEVTASSANIMVDPQLVDRGRLHRRFAARDLDDLRAVSLLIAARKPDAG